MNGRTKWRLVTWPPVAILLIMGGILLVAIPGWYAITYLMFAVILASATARLRSTYQAGYHDGRISVFEALTRSDTHEEAFRLLAASRRPEPWDHW